MDEIHELAGKVHHALEASLQDVLEIVQNKTLKPSQRVSAVNQLVRLSHLVLAKTLPDLSAKHEIHTNTNEVAKVLAKTLGPVEAKKRLEAIERSLLTGPKSAAGRPKEVTVDG